MKSIALALAFALLPGLAIAQEEMPAAKCTATVAPPAALAGWSAMDKITAADKPTGLGTAALTLGRSASVTLLPTRQVAYGLQPEKPGGSVAHGGLLAVQIADAGTYQISLDSGAWIDLVRDGKALISTAHAPGPACTGIRKTVQFVLTPGRYLLQLSANAAPTIAVMVTKVS